MGITKVADLGDTIPTIIEEARHVEQFEAIMRGLSWNIKKPDGETINIPYFSEVVANVLAEGVDMTQSETMEDTNVQITMDEVGLKIILTDVVIEDNQEDLKRHAGLLMGRAYEKKRDIDLLDIIDNASSSLAGSANALTMGHIAAARATLLGNITTNGGPAPTPYVCVIHPFQELDIVDVITPVVPASNTLNVTGTKLTDEILLRYSVGRLFGMPIVTDGNLTLTASATKGGVFAMGKGGGIIYGSAREPSVEPERDGSLRAWEMNYVGRYGVGEYLPGYIVELFADASAPA